MTKETNISLPNPHRSFTPFPSSSFAALDDDFNLHRSDENTLSGSSQTRRSAPSLHNLLSIIEQALAIVNDTIIPSSSVSSSSSSSSSVFPSSSNNNVGQHRNRHSNNAGEGAVREGDSNRDRQ